jgi:hypothetical protein
MTWPEAFYKSIEGVCWTFIVWRIGAGAFAVWKEQA